MRRARPGVGHGFAHHRQVSRDGEPHGRFQSADRCVRERWNLPRPDAGQLPGTAGPFAPCLPHYARPDSQRVDRAGLRRCNASKIFHWQAIRAAGIPRSASAAASGSKMTVCVISRDHRSTSTGSTGPIYGPIRVLGRTSSSGTPNRVHAASLSARPVPPWAILGARCSRQPGTPGKARCRECRRRRTPAARPREPL